MATHALANAPAPSTTPDKWALLRDLTAARADFNISDRDLAVLSALLSFYPGRDLADDAGLIVFPSNRTLAERAHGMAESTLRRHLATLVRAGLILRNDSPNGKRYATRDRSGVLNHVFGFNLRPLLVRAPEIAQKAESARADALALKRLRETAVIRLRDAVKMLDWVRDRLPAECNHLHDSAALLYRALRRKLNHAALSDLIANATELLNLATTFLPAPQTACETPELSGDDSQNERHYQNSESDKLESESCTEDRDLRQTTPNSLKAADVDKILTIKSGDALPLSVVLQAAPEIILYARHGIRNWRDLAATAAEVRPMLGISPDTWDHAVHSMGETGAAITLSCLLQNSAKIASPGGYLRRLAAKAEAGTFTPGPMVMALLRMDTQCPA